MRTQDADAVLRQLRQTLYKTNQMIQNHEKMKQIAQSIRFATIQELKDGYDESTDELVVITPKCHNVTFQVNEPNQQVNNQEKVAVVNEN